MMGNSQIQPQYRLGSSTDYGGQSASLEVNVALFYKDLTPALCQAVLICLVELVLFILVELVSVYLFLIPHKVSTNRALS